MKRCTKCKQEYPATAEYFYRHESSKDRLASYCKKCRIKYQKKHYQSERGKIIAKRGYLKRYNVTLEEYDKMFQQQNGCCAICGQPETAELNGIIKRLSVDHNHKTGKIRGLLCRACNLLIGYAKDNPTILSSAIGYLNEKTNQKAD